jgi:DNA-binding NarL/FixJ family response regulator
MKKVLVIEDQPQMRRNIATILEMEGFEVAVAENGREGLEKAFASLPDLILCDVMMPEMDGYAVLKALREKASTRVVPFVFLTAKGDKADLRSGMNLGADDYLTKPVSREDLLGAIDARLRRAQSQVTQAEFKPNFESFEPLRINGLTVREAEVLLWVAQGKSNPEIATILGMSDKTVKKHAGMIFTKLGVESRHAAALKALEILSGNQSGSLGFTGSLRP